MTKKNRITVGCLLIPAVCAVLLIILASLLYVAITFGQDTIAYSTSSPNGQYRTTLFYRNVGATAPISTILTIRESRRWFRSYKNSRILVLRGEYSVTVRWEADDKLTVIVEDEVAGEDVFAKVDGWQSVEIEYIPSTLTIRED